MRRSLLSLVLALASSSLVGLPEATPSHEALPTTPDWIVSETGGFGAHVSTAGDVNGDGFDDVLVGAPYWGEFGSCKGKVFLYLGSASGLAMTPAWTFEGHYDDVYLSHAKPAGDVNGDGFGDVIVGAPEYGQYSAYNYGRAWVFLGSGSGLSSTPAWTRSGGYEESHLGAGATGVGDVNGDGFDDVMVGAPGDGLGLSYEGLAFLYLGSLSGPSTIPDEVLNGNQEWAFFGSGITGDVDFNGDGFVDVLIGAPGHVNHQEEGQGRIYVFRGSASGLTLHPVKTLEIQEDWEYGRRFGPAGDIDADGFDDILVSGGEPALGRRLLVYMGSKALSHPKPDLVLEPAPDFWFSSGTAGDVNGDGFADVIMGVSQLGQGGRVFLYRGTAAGLDPVPWQTLDGAPAFQWFGFAVATAGDVNGDGFADVIIGAAGYALAYHGGS